jgi:hypothetical protein
VARHVHAPRRASWLSALCLAAALVLTATPGAVAQSPTVDTLQVSGSAPAFPNIGVNAEQTGEGLNATGLAFLQPGVGAIMAGRVTCLRVSSCPGRYSPRTLMISRLARRPSNSQ